MSDIGTSFIDSLTKFVCEKNHFAKEYLVVS